MTSREAAALLLALWASPTFAQYSFAPFQDQPVPAGVTPYVLDVDGDGDPDVALTAGAVGSLIRGHFLENTDGTLDGFVVRETQAVAGSGSFAPIDIDQDGDPDFLAEGSLLLNDGGFQFRDVPTPFGPSALPADLDLDGDLDFVDSYSLALVYEDGLGSPVHRNFFGLEPPLASPRYAFSTDLAGIGAVPVVQSGSSLYFLTPGPGETHALSTNMIPGTLPAGYSGRFRVADLDGNETPDVLLARGSRVEGVMNLDPVTTFTLSTITTFSSTISFDSADFDGDGDNEVLTCTSDYKVAIYEPGNFGFEFKLNALNTQWRGTIFAADFNMDGRTDVLGIGQSMRLWPNAGTFDPIAPPSPTPTPPPPLACEDTNADGNVDVADTLILLLDLPQ